MNRAWLEFFAVAKVEARLVPGFMSDRKGWMPFLGGRGVLSRHTGKDGLFASETEAVRAGLTFRRECRERLENLSRAGMEG